MITKITLLKLGGSVLTDKSRPYTMRKEVIKALAAEIKEALDKNPDLNLIIGNGGGSFPHQPAKKGNLTEGIKDAWQLEHLAETHRAAAELNHILVTALVKEGVPAISIKPSSAAYSDNKEIVDFNILMIDELLKLKAVPVLHGDILVDLKQGCSIASTEKLFRYIAGVMDIERVIIGTNVDGVLDDKNEVIPEIDSKNFDSIKKHLGNAGTTDVTGGMLHKVETMLELASLGPNVFIINALREGNIKKALSGEKIGTRITHD
jgi:isopentenyl phosphate kinase